MRYLKSIILLAAILTLSTMATAQEEQAEKKVDKKVEMEMPTKVEYQEPAFATSIETGSKANSTGIHNAYTIEILNADKKIVDKAWRQMMRSYKGKTKYSRNEAELATSNAKITELGSAMYKVKASIDQRGDNVVVHSWYEGTDGYVDDGSDSEHVGVTSLLDNFAVEIRKEMVKLDLGLQEKNLKQAENALDKLKRQNDSYHKDIEEAKRKIAEAEQNIIENDAAQESAVIKIDGQRTIVEAVRQRLKRIN